jgi:heme/copper-type cytochrome/quinol oxidase subunit 3
VIDGDLWLPHSILPPAQTGPVGTARAIVALQEPLAEGRTTDNVRRFFSVLLFVNGLHAVYLLFGIVLGVWLLVSRAGQGVSSVSLATSALYWVVISAIGLLLIPAFYA